MASRMLQVVRPTTQGQNEPTDQEIMTKLAHGDETAFQTLYERHGQVAYALALRLMRDPSQAEDIVQDSFLAVWRQGARFDGAKSSVRTWILSIVHHRSVDVLRCARRQRETAPNEETIHSIPDQCNIEQEVLLKLDSRRLRLALQRLPHEQRQALELAYFGGYQYPEIAALLGVPLGTVKSRLRIAIEKLRMSPEICADRAKAS